MAQEDKLDIVSIYILTYILSDFRLMLKDRQMTAMALSHLSEVVKSSYNKAIRMFVNVSFHFHVFQPLSKVSRHVAVT